MLSAPFKETLFKKTYTTTFYSTDTIEVMKIRSLGFVNAPSETSSMGILMMT
jgi:hypothetical protein